MEREQIEQKIRTILHEQKTLAQDALDDPERSLEDLGFDSLDALNILFGIEEEFQITVPDEDARSARTIRSLTDTVQEILASGETSSPPETA
jgi:acyl carrier protein